MLIFLHVKMDLKKTKNHENEASHLLVNCTLLTNKRTIITSTRTIGTLFVSTSTWNSSTQSSLSAGGMTCIHRTLVKRYSHPRMIRTTWSWRVTSMSRDGGSSAWETESEYFIVSISDLIRSLLVAVEEATWKNKTVHMYGKITVINQSNS